MFIYNIYYLCFIYIGLFYIYKIYIYMDGQKVRLGFSIDVIYILQIYYIYYIYVT